ncbi:MAG: helix-turn-helix domain-containing protein [Pseudomonadota bacterium]
MKPVQNHVHLDTSAVEPRHRLEAWNHYYDGFTTFQNLAPSSEAIHAVTCGWKFGDLFFEHYAYSQSATSMRPGGRFDDRIALRILLRGTTKALVADRPSLLKPGAVYLRDRSHRFYARHDDIEALSVSVPYEAIGYKPGLHGGLRAFDFETPMGRILRANIEALHTSLSSASPEEGQQLAEAFSAFLRTILSRDSKADIPRHPFEEARDVALRRYIEDNLGDPTLSIERICGAVGISRSALQRTFAKDGGVGRFVLRRRLEEALQDLSRRMPERGVVVAVAERWAFHDAAHFSRQFKQHFGFRPGEVVGSALTALSAADGGLVREQAERPQMFGAITPLFSLAA